MKSADNLGVQLWVSSRATSLFSDQGAVRGALVEASVMGGHYPSDGINVGPAMTFGFIAARPAAGELQ